MSSPTFQDYTVSAIGGHLRVHPAVCVAEEWKSQCDGQLGTVYAAVHRSSPAVRGAVMEVARAALEALLMAWSAAGILRRPVPSISKGGVIYSCPAGAANLWCP